MTSKAGYTASCTCGQVALEASGAPILSAVCYCESCRLAGRALEQVPGAPAVLNADGGVDYCLYRKDRVKVLQGGAFLREHRLTPTSPTRRVVASCCGAPMFLDFTKGHWLTLYRDRLPKDAPLPEMGVMAKDRPPGSASGHYTDLSGAPAEVHDQTADRMGCDGFPAARGDVVMGSASSGQGFS